MSTDDYEAGMERFGRFADEFERESPRGAAILPMCVIETLLQECIGLRLAVSDDETMRRFAPRGSIHNLTLLSRALGVIAEREQKVINDLAVIRGKFAHAALENLDFDSPEVAPFVDKLKPPITLKGISSPQSRRRWYLIVASTCHALLLVRRKYAEKITGPSQVVD